MRLLLKMTVIILALGLALSFAYSDALAAPGCCQNQNPPNGPGQGDTGGAIPTTCTNEASVANCWSYSSLQELQAGAVCPDPDGFQNSDCLAAGFPDPCCTGAGAGTCVGGPMLAGNVPCGPGSTNHRELPQTSTPALSGWGVLFFVVLASGLIVVHRRRSRTFTA